MRGLGFEQGSSHSVFLGLSPAQSLPAPRKESPTCRMTMSLAWSKVCSSVTSSQPISDCGLTYGEQFSTSSDPPGSEKPYLKVAFRHLSTSAPGPSQTSQEPGCSFAYRESTTLKCEKASVPRGILQPMGMGVRKKCLSSQSFRRRILGHSWAAWWDYTPIAPRSNRNNLLLFWPLLLPCLSVPAITLLLAIIPQTNHQHRGPCLRLPFRCLSNCIPWTPKAT